MPFWRPLVEGDLARRLETTLAYYASFRPHSGLDGATPNEVYFGLPPIHLRATSPPRAMEANGTEPAFDITYLDPEGQRLPILIANKAA